MSPRYVLGSRRRDLTVFAVLAVLAALTAPALRVYYRVTVVELTLARIDPDGARHALAVPEAVWDAPRKSWAGRQRPPAVLRSLEARIRRFMADDPVAASSPPGTRFEWRIRYSENTARLDREALVVWPAIAGVRR